jgi:hypothetical protein
MLTVVSPGGLRVIMSSRRSVKSNWDAKGLEELIYQADRTTGVIVGQLAEGSAGQEN